MSDPPVSPKLYFGIFGILLVLTATTVAVAHIDLGTMNTLVAVGIASVKAILVATYFMHLRYGRHTTWVVAVTGIFGLLIFILLTFGDYDTRDWLPPPGPSGPP